MRDMSGRTVIALNSGDRGGVNADRGDNGDASAVAGAERLASAFSDARSPDACAYFSTVERKRMLDEILAGLAEKRRVHLIEGKEGSGKSAFLRWLMQQAPAEWSFCHITARKALGEQHLLSRLNQILFPGEVLDMGALASKIKQRVREGAHIVIVVDDAERLSPFALKTLFVIKAAVEKRGDGLGLVLAAGPGIRTALAAPSLSPLAQGQVQHHLLPPFTYQQAQDYIRHCLRAAGAEQETALPPRQARRIFRLSGGLPKAINTLMQGVLQGRKVTHSPLHLVSEQLAHYRVFILSVMAFGLLGLAGYGVYRSLPERASQPPAVAALDENHLRELMVLTEAPQEETAVKKALPPASGEERKAGRSAPPAPRPVQRTPPVKKASAPAPARASTPPAAVARKASTARPASQPATQIQPESVIRNSNWVMAQDASHFTVQLTSWEDEARAKKYIERHGLENQAAYVHTRSKGKDWYLVIYNTYPTLREARQAIQLLPPPLKKYGPWVRNISSLQAEAVAGQGG